MIGRWKYRYWVEDFLTTWFRVALHAPSFSDRLLGQRGAMIEFAFSRPRWEPKTWGAGACTVHTWCHLMGFGQNVRDLWGEQHRQTINAMEPYFRRWAAQLLSFPECLAAFSVFLTNRAADSLLPESIGWIEASLKAKPDFFRERDVKECLEFLVDYCWRVHSGLRQHAASFNAFTTILRRLADVQSQTVLEIQQKLMFGTK
jgi:hypothetical protein